LERELFALLLTTKGRVEEVTSFREKRSPRFSGR